MATVERVEFDKSHFCEIIPDAEGVTISVRRQWPSGSSGAVIYLKRGDAKKFAEALLSVCGSLVFVTSEEPKE